MYSNEKPLSIKEVNSTRNDNDKRFTILVAFEDGNNLAIKAAKNCFTNAKRVKGWQSLCQHYSNIGIYCPQIVTNKNGEFSESVLFNNEVYVVYAEEAKKYRCVDEFEPIPSYESYRDGLIESIGLAASDSSFLLPWKSVWCLFDVFCEEDKLDENIDSAKLVYDTVKSNFPELVYKIEEIWKIYLQNRSDFEPIYNRLPRAAFQSDLNSSNVMLDNNKQFKGLIDFNLSGTEVILNYVLCECCYQLDTDDLHNLMNDEFLKKWDDYLIYNLNLIKKHYTFTEQEKAAYNLAYNTIVPFSCWKIFGLLKWAIKENKNEYIESILEFLMFQLTRKDLELF